MRLTTGEHHGVALGNGCGGFLQMARQAAGVAPRLLTGRRPKPVHQPVAGCAEAHLGQGALAQLAQGRIVGAQFLGVLLGAERRHAHQLRSTRQAQRVGQHLFAFGYGGHQALLVVHQNQLGIGQVKQHGLCPVGCLGSRRVRAQPIVTKPDRPGRHGGRIRR